ncbi:YqjK family protein [Hydrogenophaga sp.]|uniref:YqjK family protein n=1 Tax=Hydrogenophaga sp. TaxID=1904254 RepID=UPI0026058699|nr:YqjK family protein [Hydrogenophaga sp.]MCW5654614.1 hypothetical protein [Hydrogenophaga sp.]
MNQRARLLARRRERLLQRSTHLRDRMSAELQVVQPALSWADRLQDAWYWLRAHPLAAVAGSAALAVWRPRRAINLGLRAWSAWKLWQRMRAAAAGGQPPR